MKIKMEKLVRASLNREICLKEGVVLEESGGDERKERFE